MLRLRVSGDRPSQFSSGVASPAASGLRQWGDAVWADLLLTAMEAQVDQLVLHCSPLRNGTLRRKTWEQCTKPGYSRFQVQILGLVVY